MTGHKGFTGIGVNAVVGKSQFPPFKREYLKLSPLFMPTPLGSKKCDSPHL